MKMISKDMVEFVSTYWSQPWPLLELIFPETKRPKNTNQTLGMVVLHISQINAIGYYEKFANDVRVKNMQLFHSTDARIVWIEIKNRVVSRRTYSAYKGLRMRGFDWDSLCALPGIDWDQYQALKMPLGLISISHFFMIFSTLVLLLQVIANPYFPVLCLLMYYSVH